MEIKEVLLKACQDFVTYRLQNIEKTISSNQKALQSETKSSAGDKHETGRAMLQLEMEKASQQLAAISQMNQVLAKIDVKKTSNIAHLGSVIATEKGSYFLSISAGQLMVSGKTYFAVSISSPIGKLLLGKKVGDELVFNGKVIKLKEVF